MNRYAAVVIADAENEDDFSELLGQMITAKTPDDEWQAVYCGSPMRLPGGIDDVEEYAANAIDLTAHTTDNPRRVWLKPQPPGGSE